MRKLAHTLPILVGIVGCALSCAAIPWSVAGQQDGFTIEAFDYGPSLYWWIGMFAFFGMAILLCCAWRKIEKAGMG